MREGRGRMILTVQQLKDAGRCHELDCDFCSCAIKNDATEIVDCINKHDVVSETALAYRDMLLRVEFSNITWDGAECFICDGRNEHEAGCELEKLLKGGQ